MAMSPRVFGLPDPPRRRTVDDVPAKSVTEETMKSLQGKTALVTGASSGIGAATALALGKAGVRVALLARRTEALEAIASSMNQALVVPADVSDECSVEAAVTEVQNHFGHLDLVVNSAGIARISPVSTGDFHDWQEMINVNVLGLCLVNRAVLPCFPEGGGHIVNVCSMSGHRVPPVGGFYSATKFAVRALSDALRNELRQAGNATRVSCISPGFVDTPLVDEYFGAVGKTPAEAVDYPMLKPEEIADLIVHQLGAPENVEINDLMVRPRHQAT